MDSPRPTRIKLATYNVGDLFGDGALAPKDKKPKPEEELQAVADTLCAMDADVVALQEVQSEEVLDRSLLQRLPPTAYPYRKVFAARGSVHNVAILSRYPMSDESRVDGIPIVGQPAKATRGVAGATVDVPGWPLRFYDVHFKADPFYARPFTPQQLREAGETRRLESRQLIDVMRPYPGQHYAAAGDLNTTQDQPEVQYLVAGESAPLRDPLAGRRDPDSWSHPATQSRKDYILLDPETAKHVVSVQVVRTPQALKASDHLPVMVELELP